jgi:serine/threonine protein kinase
MNSDIMQKLDDELVKNKVGIIPKDDIVKLAVLGEGKFGKVYSGKYKDMDIAIKKMIFDNLDNETIDEIINEIKNLQVAEITHVPKFFGVWKGVKEKHYHLIFELINGKTLREVMEFLTLDDKLSIIYQIADISSTLHKKKLLHRDIKPENIMIVLDTKAVKLIDFGTAKLATKTVTFTSKAVGTTFYMAPDFYNFENDDDSDKPISNSHKVDVWSIGCMISELLSGTYPWHNVTKSETKIEALLIKGHPFPIPKAIDDNFPQFKTLIERCTQTNPDQRCTSEDIKEFLLPYLKK